MQLSNRVCLVTGATGGIGHATIEALLRRGADLVATGRDEDVLHALAQHPRVRALPCDLAGPGAAQWLAVQALSVHGHVDVVVNCAGAGLHGPLASVDPDEVARVVASNLVAPIELTRALLPPMLERRSGHVVNVGSIVGHVGRGGEAVYAATKAGLAVFSESLRVELRDTGVSVSLVSPGVVDTGFFDRRGAVYDRRWPRPIPPARVADAIVRAIERDLPEVLVPGWLAVPARVRGAAPGLYRALARRFD